MFGTSDSNAQSVNHIGLRVQAYPKTILGLLFTNKRSDLNDIKRRRFIPYRESVLERVRWSGMGVVSV